MNPFFSSLGTNHRTCLTCHAPQTGWSVSAAEVKRRFYAEPLGLDPIFRKVDGATCPNVDDASSIAKRLTAYKLLINSGLFRVALPLPPRAAEGAGFVITAIDDPYSCSNNAVVNVRDGTPTGKPIYSFYRRPLPATNLHALVRSIEQGGSCPTASPTGAPCERIMWDGREPSLEQQFKDATMGHAQGDPAQSYAEEARRGVEFEMGLLTAQEAVYGVGSLKAAGAKGGSQILASFARENSVGARPKTFDLFDAWADSPDPGRASIARGQELFNTRRCTNCHNVRNVGSSERGAINSTLGISDFPRRPGLKDPGLPVFHVRCDNGEERLLTDLGRAMITGLCADLGAFKTPNVRGLASRAPYFHDGSAPTMADVVLFYDARFELNLTEQEKRDLVNFLNAL